MTNVLKRLWSYKEIWLGILITILVTGVLVAKNLPIFKYPNFYAEDEIKYHGHKEQRGTTFMEF